MPSPSARLGQLIASRHGVVTKAELLADGYTEHTIRRQVTAGALVRVHAGVYRIGTTPETFEGCCAAACLADPSIVVTSISAGKLWGFRPIPRHDIPIVMTHVDQYRLARGAIVRRCGDLPDDHVVRRDDGIRVASPPRAWFDCGRDLNDDQFERLTEWVLDQHAGVPTLWGMRRAIARRGRNGSARVNRVLSRRPTWQKPADSGLELTVLRALEARGIGPLVRQYAITLPNGITIHADGAIPDIKWAVEVDHVTWHGGRATAQEDKARDRAVRRIGWQVDRVTDTDVRERLRATIDELVELVDLRRHAA